MRFLRFALPVFVVALASAVRPRAAGLLIPDDKKLPPLAMVNHKVTVAIEDQVAVTTVEQTFRNHTDRDLEATYIFPVPKGASVDKFTMWVDGKEIDGRAGRGREGPPDLHRHRPPHAGPRPARIPRQQPAAAARLPGPAEGRPEGRRSASRRVAAKDGGVVEYVYPLKTDGKATEHARRVLASRSTLKSQHPIQNIYSPTHAITIKRNGDKEVDRRASRRTRRCSTRTSSSSTASATRTSA